MGASELNVAAKPLERIFVSKSKKIPVRVGTFMAFRAGSEKPDFANTWMRACNL